jgi:hypothetical protein
MGNIELEADLGYVINALEAPVSDHEKGEGWTTEKKAKYHNRLNDYRAQISRDEVVEPLSSTVRDMKSDGVEPSKIADMISRIVFTHGLTRR